MPSDALARGLSPRLGIAQTTSDSGSVLVDLFGTSKPVALDAVSSTVFRMLSRGASVKSVRAAAKAEHGVGLSRADIADFVDDLAEMDLLESPRWRRARRARFAQLVADNAFALHDLSQPPRAEVEWIIEAARQRVRERLGPLTGARLEGALSPHGVLQHTGLCSAHAYALLQRQRWPDVFVIVGTSHYLRDKPALLTHDILAAGGRVETDRALALDLHEQFRPKLRRDHPVFMIEHSWRQDLPLLQAIADDLQRPLRVVALLAGGLDFADGSRLGRLIGRLLFAQRKQGCLIASGDLTHYGLGYSWRPPWLETSRLTVAQVCRRIARFEEPLLQAIESRDIAQYRSQVAQSSFCAKSQVATLLECATSRGALLARQSVLNWQPMQQASRRRWLASDALFNGASIAFWRGGSARAQSYPALRMCSDVLLHQQRGSTRLLHRCDQSALELPNSGLPLVDRLLSGAQSVSALVDGLDDAPEREDVDELVELLARTDWLHPPDEASVEPSALARERARRTIRQARQQVEYYRRTLTSDELASAPLLFSSAIKRHWPELCRDGAPSSFDDETLYAKRRSSGSTGNATGRQRSDERLLTVTERSVRDARSHACLWINAAYARDSKAVQLNRPSNLSLRIPAAGRVTHSDGWGASRLDTLTPGPNPTGVSSAAWDRCIELIDEAQPVVIEGEPSYVATLARRCLALGVTFDSLERIYLGHAYCWQLYRDVIERAFGVPIIGCLNSSELGDVAVTCSRGHLHLLETNVLYEVLHRGRAARAGEIGYLTATTLDTQLRPLIRYVTGDLVSIWPDACECGRPFRVIAYEGRAREVFRDGRGRLVTQRAIDAAIGSPPGVRFFRLVIPAVDSPTATLEIVPTGSRDIVDAGSLSERLADLLQKRVRVQFKRSIALVRPNGKLHSLSVTRRSHRSSYAEL